MLPSETPHLQIWRVSVSYKCGVDGDRSSGMQMPPASSIVTAKLAGSSGQQTSDPLSPTSLTASGTPSALQAAPAFQFGAIDEATSSCFPSKAPPQCHRRSPTGAQLHRCATSREFDERVSICSLSGKRFAARCRKSDSMRSGLGWHRQPDWNGSSLIELGSYERGADSYLNQSCDVSAAQSIRAEWADPAFQLFCKVRQSEQSWYPDAMRDASRSTRLRPRA